MVMKRDPAGDTVETVNSTSTEEVPRDVVRRIGPVAKEARRARAARGRHDRAGDGRLARCQCAANARATGGSWGRAGAGDDRVDERGPLHPRPPRVPGLGGA